MDKKTYKAIQAEARKRIEARKAKGEERLSESVDDRKAIVFESADDLIRALLEGDE